MEKPSFPTEEQGQIIQWAARCERLEARVAELEGAVRTLHALAESHFGVGTIDVPAMPELHRK